jgi:cell division protein FtsB
LDKGFSVKIYVVLLLLLLALLQYRLWFAEDGLVHAINLKQTVAAETQKNLQQKNKNELISSEISSLKQGGSTIESIARKDLGMIKKGEIFYQVVK